MQSQNPPVLPVGDGPFFSVILPTYNRRDQLPQAIESVLGQTFSDLDVWVVDDGSTDGTREVVAPYLNRINYISQPNSGPGPARDLGIASSRGSYLAFLDSDDRWESTKLEVMARAIANRPDVGLFYSDVRTIDETGRQLWVQEAPHVDGNGYVALLTGNFVTTSAVVASRKAVVEAGGFAESGLFGPEDWDLWLRIAHSYPILHVPGVLAERRIGAADAITATEDLSALHEVVNRALARDPHLPPRQRRKARGMVHYAEARTHLDRGDTSAAIAALRASVARYPTVRGTVYLLLLITGLVRHLPTGLAARLRIPPQPDPP